MSTIPSITPALFNALVEALTIILPLTSPADVGLKYFFREHPKLGHRDRGISPRRFTPYCAIDAPSNTWCRTAGHVIWRCWR